jgi:hypothetical protein
MSVAVHDKQGKNYRGIINEIPVLKIIFYGTGIPLHRYTCTGSTGIFFKLKYYCYCQKTGTPFYIPPD